jgi:hypothetical protein
MVEGWAVAAVGWGWAAVGWAAVGCREEERVEKGWVAVGWAAVGWGEEEREEGGWEGAGWVAERAAAEALKGGTHCWVAEDWGAPALEHMAGVAAAKLAAQCSAAMPPVLGRLRAWLGCGGGSNTCTGHIGCWQLCGNDRQQPRCWTAS